MNEDDLKVYTGTLKVSDTESTYTLSTDEQNWIISDRPYRLWVTNEFLNEAMISNADFLQVIINLITLSNSLPTPIIYKGKYTTVVYINEIDSGDVSVVTPYLLNGDIIMETKAI
jgi:hypothetical protein